VTQLNEEEIKTLKELAEDLQASSRVGRFIKSGLIWLASSIAAGSLIWEFFLKK
jgi:hypothetical protein